MSENEQADKWKSGLATWRSGVTSEDDLTNRLFDILDRNAVEVTRVQGVLRKQLNTDDGDQLAKQLAWLDSQLIRMATLHAEADALLDVAENFYLIPAGEMRVCIKEDGTQFVDSGGKPKYREVTDPTRQIELKAKCVPFRRLRDEYRIICEIIRNRQFLGQRVLDELSSRNKAIGQSLARR